MKQMWYVLFEKLSAKFEFLTQFKVTKYKTGISVQQIELMHPQQKIPIGFPIGYLISYTNLDEFAIEVNFLQED